MVENNGLASTFRLGPFPRIVDDERVKIGQCAESKLRTAARAQPGAFARQPFGAAVLADMHHGMGLVIQADPEVLGQVAVRRWKIRGVQIRDLIRVIPSVGLDQNRDVSVSPAMYGKAGIAVEIAGLFRRSPPCLDPFPRFSWNGCPPILVNSE